MKQESRTNINRVKKDISSPESFTPPEELKRQLITTMQSIYDEEDIEKLSFILSLQKLHFAHEDIKIYMQLYLLGDQTKLQRIKILKRKRQQLLDHIHDTQKELDALDCLLYKVNG